MKIKLGITTPLFWRTSIRERMPQLEITLPAFGQVNFAVPPQLSNGVELWQEGYGGVFSCRFTGEELFSPFQFPVRTNAVHRQVPCAGDVLAPGVVRTADPLAFPKEPVDLWLLVDASEGMNDLLGDLKSPLRDARDLLPAGSRVFVSDTKTGVSHAALSFGTSPAYLSHDLAMLPRYVGGTDPAPAIARTLREAREKGKDAHHASVVVFLHAASPAQVSDLSAVRQEMYHGLSYSPETKPLPPYGPALLCVQLAPHAPDAVAMDLAGFSNVYTRRALPGPGMRPLAEETMRFAAQAASASGAFQVTGVGKTPVLLPTGGQSPAANGVTFTSLSAKASPSASLSRLYKASETTWLWFASNRTGKASEALDMRIAAGQPAAEARLVTPVSSAVVLETQAQYEAHGLDTKSGKKGYENAKNVPDPNKPNVNIPEPHTVLLLGVGLLVGLCAVPRLRYTVKR